jgi:hypothetical protein
MSFGVDLGSSGMLFCSLHQDHDSCRWMHIASTALWLRLTTPIWYDMSSPTPFTVHDRRLTSG